MKSDVQSLYVLGGVGVSFQLVIWFGDDLFRFIVWVIDLGDGLVINVLVVIVIVG